MSSLCFQRSMLNCLWFFSMWPPLNIIYLKLWRVSASAWKQTELEDVDDEYEYRAISGWIDEFVNQVLPRLYRSPLLVELWAVFESGVIKIAKYLQKSVESH